MQFDSVQIGVPELTVAARDYALLLGVTPEPAGSETRRFQLGHGAVELELGEPATRSLCFVGGPETSWPSGRESFHGLDVRVEPAIGVPPPRTCAAAGVEAIDHLVIHSPDLDRAIELWRDRLGIRLARSREFPERGLRMAFFRSAGVTLEFVSSLPPPAQPAGPDRLYGIAYRVPSLAACRARLIAGGVDVGAVRPGHKLGTLVASVRSGTAGVPTLLIEDPSRVSHSP
ncbi:MAG: VOC family protein [Deltaproteobacteria bacterium]|nr:VOC family protein [Deltaproteobacteria bacterium]